MKSAIDALLDYGERNGLSAPEDRVFLANSLLDAMKLDAPGDCDVPEETGLPEILDALTDDAVGRGVLEDNQTARDLFDTRLMGVLTPAPHEIRACFRDLYSRSPQDATDWFYRFCQDVNYIRRDRIARDRKWVYACAYGDLDITINLSKPEKDPRAIAAAKLAPQSGYPVCQLCAENEGYAGRMNHPARQNLRMIPLTLDGGSWFFQYSPYVYYNEHCIVLNSAHVPMQITDATFRRLLDFVTIFPHYFLGSNADLPIVGGSILSHDHFQGGRYVFAMERAPIEQPLVLRGFEDLTAGIVRWPMSVLRIRGKEPARLAAAASHITECWRGWTDESVGIYAFTDGTPHNTVTPIARRRGEEYELDLVLRNNRTTEEHPLGLFHPHERLHHIKKENIGLIEVMGLAVLPARLDRELALLEEAILSGRDLRADETLEKHADWAEELMRKYAFTAENAGELLRREVGEVFRQVLEDAGVYKRTPEGQEAFARFAASL